MQRDRYSGWWPLLGWLQCIFCCRSPWWSVFPFTDQDQQKPPFPDLHHQTAVGVTFSYAKNHCALFKNLAPYKCQSEKQAYAVTKENRKTLFIRRGLQSRCECSSIQVLVVSRMQLTTLRMAFFIAARLQLGLKWVLKTCGLTRRLYIEWMVPVQSVC